MKALAPRWRLAAVMLLMLLGLSFATSAAPRTATQPLQTSTLSPAGHFGGYLASLTVPSPGGAIAYLGAGSGIMVLDISDPTSLHQVGGLSMSESGDVSRVSVNGAMACALQGTRLQLLDISDTADPQVVSGIKVAYGAYASDAAWSGDYAFVLATSSDYQDRLLQVYDLTDPVHPSLASSQATEGRSQYITVANGKAYITGGFYGDLVIYDITSPESPTYLGTYDSPGDAYQAAVSGNAVYLAAGVDGGLQIVDVSNPASPSRLGQYVSGQRRQVVGARRLDRLSRQ